MVATLDYEMFQEALHTPRADPSDSEGVLLALETARAMEAQGEMRAVARWIRHAADEAEKDGNDERVLVLARAAAELMNLIESAPDATGTLPPPSQTGSIAPTLAALVSSIPPFCPRPFAPALASFSSRSTMPPSDWSEPTIPPSPSPPTIPAPIAYTELSPPADKRAAAGTICARTIRVAITGSIGDAKSFSVERLDPEEPLSAGAMEAILVLTGEVEGRIEIRSSQRSLYRISLGGAYASHAGVNE